mmetsp:Transcript_76527/g.177581  ORF Transcript_76527/g.177581 Transcript_76527/m.177581 type:complete len:265 (-) Transcript_76527:2270-3064(-)
MGRQQDSSTRSVPGLSCLTARSQHRSATRNWVCRSAVATKAPTRFSVSHAGCRQGLAHPSLIRKARVSSHSSRSCRRDWRPYRQHPCKGAVPAQLARTALLPMCEGLHRTRQPHPSAWFDFSHHKLPRSELLSHLASVQQDAWEGCTPLCPVMIALHCCTPGQSVLSTPSTGQCRHHRNLNQELVCWHFRQSTSQPSRRLTYGAMRATMSSFSSTRSRMSTSPSRSIPLLTLCATGQRPAQRIRKKMPKANCADGEDKEHRLPA